MDDQNTVLVGRSNTTIKDGSSTSSVGWNSTLHPKPGKAGLAATFDVPPPTAPRSMRRDISPPPLRRSDTYRPSEPQERRGQFDSYRPVPSRHSGHIHPENRYPVYDRYRPYTTQDDGNVDHQREPKYPSRGYDIGAPETRVGGPRRYLWWSKDSREDNRKSVIVGQKRVQPSTSDLGTYSDKTGGSMSQSASIPRRQETEKQVAPNLNNTLQPISCAGLATKNNSPMGQQNVSEGDSEVDMEVDDGHSGDFQNSLKACAPGLASSDDSPTRDSSALPLSHASTPRIIIPQLPESPPYSPPLSIHYDSDDHRQYGRSAAVDKETMIEALDKGTWVKTSHGFAGLWLPHSSNAETASTSSTTSRTKNLCKSCRTPGSQLTPLVPCSSCRRGFHNRCGNPKPTESERLEDFVCGRCLKKEREAASNNYSEAPKIISDAPTIEDNSPPANATQPSTNRTATTIKWAGPEKSDSGMTRNMTGRPNMLHAQQQAQSSPGSAAQAANVVPDAAIQGTRYKHITCPKWQSDGCFLAEAHCEFAHNDTGRSAPFGSQRAKDFTCPRWLSGICLKTETDCQYAHANTGLYVGADHKASKKHITCYYWYTAGRCRLADEVCLYAHEDTGIVAWQPTKEAQAKPGEPCLKSYTCPRWEAREHCKWVGKTCPYAHWPGGKSCLTMDEPPESRQSAETPPPQASIPPWAKSARRSPVALRATIAFPDRVSQISTEEIDQPFSLSSESFVGQRQKLPSEPSNLNVNAQSAAADSPIKHKAKRSNVDPRKRKIASTMSSRVPIPTLTLPAAMSPTMSQTIPAGKKSCEICQKTIFNTSRCVECSDGTTGSNEAAPSAEVSVSMTQTNISSFVEDGVPEEVIEDDIHISLRRPPNDALLREALVANRLKRSAPEDNLFVSKKPKLSLSALEQVKDAAAGACVSGPAGATGERRQSLEELTRQAMIEKEKSTDTQQAGPQLELVEQTQTETDAVQETSHLHPSGPPSLTTPGQNKGVDPSQDESARTTGRSHINPEPPYSKFSKNEHEVFSVAYAQYPGNFEKIAEFFPRRTMQDCFKHYRITRHRDNAPTDIHNPGTAPSVDSQLSSEQSSVDDRTSVLHTQTGRAMAGPNVVRPESQHLSEQSVPVTAGGDSRILLTTFSPNASQNVLLPNGLLKRCCNCSKGHKRCFHDMTGNLDAEKCSRFLREHNNQYPGRNKVARREWNEIVRVARTALSDEPESQSADTPFNQDDHVEDGASVNGEVMDVDELVSQSADTPVNQDEDRECGSSTNVEVVDLNELEDEEGDSEDDIPLLQVRRQSYRRQQSGTPQHSATSRAEYGDVRQISGLTAVNDMQETGISDPWRASTSSRPLFEKSISVEGASNGLLSPFQPPIAGPGLQRPWSKADKAKAIRKLQARGVVFESDSDEEMDDDPVYELPSRRIDPLWQPQQSMDLLEIDRWRAQKFERRSYASSEVRPYKKQIVGNLLKYQCRDRRRRFGNPHQEISRHVPDVEVRAWVQRNLQEGQLEVPELVEEEKMMTFRQFIGIPETPVIVQGRNKDELAFMEGKGGQEKTRYGTGIAALRSRRKKEEDKFPFVYYR
ncbi:hypothetical protein, variant 2 [Exophiala xenobiotica]|uniref:PHD-type domain-containing protein n=1 Tax=Exophiala xenobiotica TaxID=348802 RepID=A0A0D2BH59_9EURO|nr:hypothetical protein, variant 2 [Exophiala xenobiotica]XP_013312105.1 hypothetical protein, variant 1 [Exophiala xenobiotica]KIW51521.1 hypothetical protein, variant 1 [Exophiala xenobiotica]KIW51522.1 hypothetical protein, variant 2 [Exophiala xenobiotica]